VSTLLDPVHAESLEARARRLPFFALVQHLERLDPAAAPVGGRGPVSAESIRFHHDVNLVFHPGDVAALRFVTRRGSSLAVLTTTFLGIVGSVSPLATFFTEDVLRGEAHDDPTLRAFYDVFHHRLIALLYRALSRAVPGAEVRARGDDRVTLRSLAMVGLVPASAEGASSPPGSSARAVTPREWLGASRALGRRPRSRDALEAALRLALPHLPSTVIDFVPRDVPLAEDQRAQLGVANVTLGRGARLGRHLLRQSGLVRVAVGPVDRGAFDGLMPGGVDHARVRGAVDAVLGGLLDAEVEIEIACGAEPRARLGGSGGGSVGTRLGRTALVVRPRTSVPVRARVALTDDAAESSRPEFLARPA
jgi:type VI secretion system protein ImpH